MTYHPPSSQPALSACPALSTGHAGAMPKAKTGGAVIPLLAACALLTFGANSHAQQTLSQEQAMQLIQQRVQAANSGQGKLIWTFQGQRFELSRVIAEQEAARGIIHSAMSLGDGDLVTLLIPKLASGSYTTQSGARLDSTAMMKGAVYNLKLTVNAERKGQIISGTFTGDAYRVNGKKKSSKPSDTPSGTISGSFSNVPVIDIKP